MAQEVIWAGSSSFSSGDTPWGLYDTDNEFTSSADKFADWSARRLGYPIMAIELQSGSFYACFEEAVTEYRFTVHMKVEWYDVRDDKVLMEKSFSGWGAYGLSGDISTDGIDNDGDGLLDGEDNDEFGDPREFATSVAVIKIAEDVLNEIMTSW